jgi:hypothetical protein
MVQRLAIGPIKARAARADTRGMNWQAEVAIIRPDHQHSSKRWLFFEAADREAAEALIPALVPKGGYVGYELSAILSLTPAVAAAA